MSLEYLVAVSEKLEYLINLLVSRATGNEKVSDNDYIFLRNELLENDKLREFLPDFIKTHSSISSFWPYIKAIGTYDERRQYINDSFKDARARAESNKILAPPMSSLASSKDFIKSEIQKFFKENSSIKNIYGEFILEKKSIGNGGTSEVKQFKFDSQNFAIKFLHENIAEKESKAFLRFKQAHLNILNLQHLGVVLPQLHMDALHISDDLIVPYVVMPLAESTLKAKIDKMKKGDQFNFELFARIFESLMNTIQTLHENGVIHRDIKPENIFIYKDKLVLGDFDIAKFDEETYVKLIETKPSDRLANYSYSAPEQVTNGGKVSEASDWYAFGQILHWLIFGNPLRGQQKVNIIGLDDSYHVYAGLIDALLSESPENRPSSKDAITKYLNKARLPVKLNPERILHEFEEIFFKYMPDLGGNGSDIRRFDAEEDIKDIMGFLANNSDRFNLYWSQGYSDNHIRKFSRLNDKQRTWLIFPYELKVQAVWLFKHYYNLGCSVVAIETKAMEPVGTYEDYTNVEAEEYAVFDGEVITRKEHDAGWALINSKRVRLNDKSELRVRSLKDDLLFIAPHAGPLVRHIDLIDSIYNEFKKTRTLKKDTLEPLNKIIKQPHSYF